MRGTNSVCKKFICNRRFMIVVLAVRGPSCVLSWFDILVRPHLKYVGIKRRCLRKETLANAVSLENVVWLSLLKMVQRIFSACKVGYATIDL